VAPSKSPVLESVPALEVKLGDLEDLEKAIKQNGADLIICNSHAVDTARRLGLPLYRAGFPQYDLIGGYQKLWVGYKGTRQTLFDLANLMVSFGHHEMVPYRSIYSGREEDSHAAPETHPLH
jgi:nitrogenase molybdenum-iron protein NifN